MTSRSTSPVPTALRHVPTTGAVVGGTVLTGLGDVIENGVVVWQDGRLTAVGGAEEIDIPADAEVTDATGLWVAPGLVEAHGHVGIDEEGNGPVGDDVNEPTDPARAGTRALDAIAIDDEGFRDALAGGVTTVVVKPGSGNPIGGRTVAIKSWGGRTVDEQIVRADVSVKAALGENPKRFYGSRDKLPATRTGVAYVIRRALRQAQDYRTRQDAAASERKPFDRDLDLEALVEVLDGNLVWDQHVHRADDIATALRLADEFGYRLVINHGTEAHKLADILAERDIPVIFGPMLTSRSKVELRDRAISNVVALARAGVRVALTTDHPVIPINFLQLEAALAVREGLDRTVALRAVTSEPAAMLGLDDRVGALEPGRDADVVVWSGDPLDAASRALRVLIGGGEVYRWDAAAEHGHVTERAERFGA